MKKKFGLIIPSLTLLALSACTTVNNNGTIDQGGTKVETQETAVDNIAKAVDATSKSFKEGKGLSFSFNSSALSLKGGAKGAVIDAKINGFNLDGTFNLLDTGAVEASLTTSGIGVDVKADITVQETTKNLSLNINTGNAGIYLKDNTLYADLSNNNFGPAVVSLLGQFLGEQTAKSAEETVKAMFKDLKFSYELGETSASISLPTLTSLDEGTAKQYLTTYLSSLEENTELTFDDICQVYKYDNGKVGIQLELDQEAVAKLPEDVKSSIGNAGIKLAIMTDENLVFNKISLSVNANVSSDTLKDTTVSWDFSLSLNSKGINPITFPEDLDTYTPFAETRLAIMGSSMVSILPGLLG